MSAVLLAVFNDYETADRVRLELFRDGFPTDRVDLTAVCDLGRAACQPAAQPLGIEAGLHLVLAFDAGPGRARLDDVAAVTALAEQGLLCAPLSAYYAAADSASMTGLVCGYARLPETRARAAATVIAEVLTALGRPTRPRRRAPRQTPGPPAPRGRTAAARRSG